MEIEEYMMKDISKALELLWLSRDIMAKKTVNEEDASILIGNLRRTEEIIFNLQSNLCSSQDES